MVLEYPLIYSRKNLNIFGDISTYIRIITVVCMCILSGEYVTFSINSALRIILNIN